MSALVLYQLVKQALYRVILWPQHQPRRELSLATILAHSNNNKL